MSVQAIPRILNPEKMRRYCEDESGYRRRTTREVMVGTVGIGGQNPIRIQSMTTSDTLDTKETVRQIKELYHAGCEIVRVTAPSIKEAENLKEIRDTLRRDNLHVPIVADIHFTPNAALKAAEFVEKVRINPGNYADKKKFAVLEYSDRAYAEELERIEESFKPLVLKCKTNGVAMRIGTNHGSLSDRIMNRFGDTPLGMVESALEFVDICERYDYHDIVLSMKASNVQVMIAAYRLLAARMMERGMNYPFHLGVTEAGDGDDGRIKSAVGIGALLADGLGDTVRVSLTEDSLHEIPAARHIVGCLRTSPESQTSVSYSFHNPFEYSRRWTQAVEAAVHSMGGVHHVRVELPLTPEDADDVIDPIKKMKSRGDALPDSIRLECGTVPIPEILRQVRSRIDDAQLPINLNLVCGFQAESFDEVYPLADMVTFPMPAEGKDLESTWSSLLKTAVKKEKLILQISVNSGNPECFSRAAQLVSSALNSDFRNIGLEVVGDSLIHPARRFVEILHKLNLITPLALRYVGQDKPVLYDAATQLGTLLCDGIGDSISIVDSSLSVQDNVRLAYNILQACRLRISKTEFISCPSCGRTLFDLQEVTSRIKTKTGHLKGVKIAIMGCIVNGPGEMADADFGYVGASVGRINLYVGKELVERNVDMKQADERLIALIKEHGMWTDAPSGNY